MIHTQLRTFLMVCDTGSFSKAASALYMTPSAVLQQIKALEKDLAVTLFYRRSTGVVLTPAGSYLEKSARSLMQQSEEIRRNLLAIGSTNRRITIASSLMEKVRLLYDLWMLYSQQANDCDIRMLSIDKHHIIPEGTDLVESINSNVPWTKDWEFMEICKVDLGFAVNTHHPFAERTMLSLNDLRSSTVVTINAGSCDTITSMLSLLKDNHIHVEVANADLSPDQLPLWQSAFSQNVLIVPLCWSDILINMKVIPFDHRFSLPYGIFYRPDPGPAVRQFLDFIYQTYHEGNLQGIVPVLG